MYKVVRKANSFGAKDVILSKHKTEQQAQKAFDKTIGVVVLLSPDGKQINHKLV